VEKLRRKRTSLERELLGSITAAGLNWDDIAPPRSPSARSGSAQKRFLTGEVGSPTEDMKFVVEEGGSGDVSSLTP